MNVYGKKIYLRAMEPEDMEMYREMANDPETERLLGGWSFPISKREQLSWYERAVSDKNNLRFTIVVQETEEASGMLNLVDIDWKNGSAFHGIRLSGNKGKGFGTDAVMTIMKYAFEELRLIRLDGSFIEYNLPSQGLYKKCGWVIEGTKKKAYYRNGQHYNLLIAGITDEEYFEIKERLGY